MMAGDEAVVCDLPEMRHVDAADFIGVGTAGMEDAALGQVEGARHFAADDGPAPVVRVRPGHGGDEHLRIGVERVVEDGVSGPNSTRRPKYMTPMRRLM